MYDQFSSSTMQLNEIYYEVNTTFIPKQVGFIRAVVVAGRQAQKKGREQHAGFGSGVWGLAKRVDLFCSHPGISSLILS
jgi:hypothetical protein